MNQRLFQLLKKNCSQYCNVSPISIVTQNSEVCCKITADNWGNILMLVLSIYLPYAHIFSQMEPLCCYLKGIQLMSTLLFVKFYITSKTKEMSYLIQMPSWENISHLSEQLRASCCSATSTISE